MLLLVGVVACKYNDDDLWNKINSLDDRIASLEDRLNQMNSDITSMSTIVNALENSVTVSNVKNKDDGSYEISFSDGQKITIKNGKDGVDAPIIGIDQLDGVYYWTQTVQGTKSWLTDADGNKIAVAGASAITPRLKVGADDYWMVSYDNGVSYIQILNDKGKPVKAVGRNGQDGESGMNGDSFFRDVKVENGELILTLMDGSIVKLVYSADIENNPFTFILNIDDPEILMAEIDGQNVIHFYGKKNSEGLAESISTIVVKNQADGNTTITVDDNQRPTYIEAANGVTYELIWETETTGILNAFDPSSNVRVNIAFDTKQANGVAESQVVAQFAAKRSGMLRYEILPLRNSESYKRGIKTKTAEYNDQQCLVTFQKCDDYYDPTSVYLAVTSQKTGSYLSELREYTKEGTGKYLFHIPSEIYPSTDWKTIANWTNEVLKGIGTISTVLVASGGDYILCSAVAVGLAGLSEGVLAPAIPAFTSGCTTTVKAFATLHLVNTGGFPDVDTAPTLSDLLIQALINNKVIKREYTDNLILTPIVDGTLSGGHGAEGVITPDDNSVIIPVITDGTPLIARFYLDPANPIQGQSYIAHAFLQCMPIGSTVTMNIVGTDEYVDTKVSTLETANSEVTLYVPGAAQGVSDIVTVTVSTPEGETHQAIASLYFH